MTTGSGSAADLRRMFDASFAAVPGDTAIATDDLLAIRIGADSHALRLSEIAGVFSGRTTTPVASHVPSLLGVAGFRGAIVPVFDLSALLGYPPATSPRWLVTAARRPIAFAFAELEGYVRVPRDAVATSATAVVPHVRELADAADRQLAIVSLTSIIAALEQHVKER